MQNNVNDSGRFRNELTGIKYSIIQLQKDMYHGNGKPALTVRMALVEDTLEKINDNLKWFVRLTIAAIATAVASTATAIVLLILHSVK